jgi:hypothetical protein
MKDVELIALELIAEKKKKVKYLKTCYKAEICPECGLKLELGEKSNKYLSFQGLKVLGIQIIKPITLTFKSVIVKCPKDHKLISPYDFSDDTSYLGSRVWYSSIGKINKAHDESYGNDGDYQ